MEEHRNPLSGAGPDADSGRSERGSRGSPTLHSLARGAAVALAFSGGDSPKPGSVEYESPLTAKRWLEITETGETVRRLIYSNITLSSTWTAPADSGAWPGAHRGAQPAAGGGEGPVGRRRLPAAFLSPKASPDEQAGAASKSACSLPCFSLKGGKEPHQPSMRVST